MEAFESERIEKGPNSHCGKMTWIVPRVLLGR